MLVTLNLVVCFIAVLIAVCVGVVCFVLVLCLLVFYFKMLLFDGLFMFVFVGWFVVCFGLYDLVMYGLLDLWFVVVGLARWMRLVVCCLVVCLIKNLVLVGFCSLV